MSFKFIQNNDSFSWESDSIKVEFSSPSIQPFKSNMIMTSSKDIMYYYYVVSIFKNVVVDWNEETDEEIYEWELVTSRDTHDFDCIRQLQFILNEMLTNDSIEDCQRIKYQNGNVEYQKVLRTEGFGCDDYYEITKIRNEENNRNHYHVYIGCSFSINADKESVGIKTAEYVTTEDLMALKECVDGFINYSIESENKRIEQRNKLIKESFEVIGVKLYQYEYSEEENKVYKDKIESIYSVGDFIDIDTIELEDYIFNEQIINITKEYVELNNIKINISDIIHIFNEVSDEKLKYNVSQTKEYFMSKMDENIINDFKNLNENMLIKKYTSAIINSVWLCRNEHNLPIIVKEDSKNLNVANAKEHAKNIILKIREELLSKGE